MITVRGVFANEHTNVFDALESVAKEKNAMPVSTFGQVGGHIPQNGLMNDHIVSEREGINTLRNRNFGNGTAAPFGPGNAEVDLTYLICVGTILCVARMP